MHRYSHRLGSALTVLALGLTLLAPGAAPAADTSYKIRRIVQIGDSVGGQKLQGGFAVGALNDSGQLAFLTATILNGSGLTNGNALLFQYANNQLVPLVVPGQEAPGGTKWAADVHLSLLLSMNRYGNLVFCATVATAIPTGGERIGSGTFLWNYQTQKLTAVALPGMPAVDNLTFIQGGGYGAAINNRDEIAFTAQVEKPRDSEVPGGYGVFFLGQDGRLQPVALPGQERPEGGAPFGWLGAPAINDAGAVAFLESQPFRSASAYRWATGVLTPVALFGAPAPDGDRIGVSQVWLNNKNQNVLVENSPSGNKPISLYRFADGQLTTMAGPDQAMPGGGQLKSIQYWGESGGNDRGEHAFLAELTDGATAAYRIDADGNLSLILKSGTTTDLGLITRVGTHTFANSDVGLNNKDQVALTLTIDNGPATLVLLTPVPPQ
jgi:hypothetical protein